jgi:hypothetical protein
MANETTKTPVLAFNIVDDFDLPAKASKYPWASIAQGKTVVFPGINKSERERVLRSVTAAGRKHNRRFQSKTIPPGTMKDAEGKDRYPQGALAVKYVGPRKKNEAPVEASQAAPEEALKTGTDG